MVTQIQYMCSSKVSTLGRNKKQNNSLTWAKGTTLCFFQMAKEKREYQVMVSFNLSRYSEYIYIYLEYLGKNAVNISFTPMVKNQCTP